MAKINSPGSEFSRDREIKVILEDMQSQFRVFGEGLQDVREKVTGLDHKITHVDEKVSRLELKVIGLDHKVTGLDQKVSSIDHRLINVEKDVTFIKMALPTVATKDDLRQFEKRLMVLERAR